MVPTDGRNCLRKPSEDDEAEMDRINTIELENLLPLVFEGERIPQSEIWDGRAEFCRPGLYMVEARSGGGKSSLVSFIYGARCDYRGRILFNGKDIRSLTISEWQELRRCHLGYLPQELMLFPELTAVENIEIKNSLTRFRKREEIIGMLGALGMGDRVDWPAGRLSVGQQQRVAIVRALCQPMDFLLIDEPVSHLDADNNLIAAEMIATEAARQGAAVIATSVGNPLSLDYSQQVSL